VVGPHFEAICRDWALSAAGDDVFAEAPGEVAAGVVADPLRRSQIQVDVAVFAPDDPGRPRRILSLGEVTWDKVMNLGHLDRLRRARDLLAVKGYDTSVTRLTCYSGAPFDPGLCGAASADPLVQLVGLDTLYGMTAVEVASGAGTLMQRACLVAGQRGRPSGRHTAT
jgi:hypothetical protein